MGIEFKKGSIFDEKADALVNPVNCVGVMGNGLALRFRRRFPKNFTAYARACKYDQVRPGKLFVHETGLETPRLIVNFPTKVHWKQDSRIEYISDGLLSLIWLIREREIKSIAIPKLGCGLGGLKWEVVRDLIISNLESHLLKLQDVHIIVLGEGRSQ
jgi:O-acetyl-ADP-ribose deacetylase (regulator of RNase III)